MSDPIGMTVAGQAIESLYSITDLWRASETAEPKHQPKRWLQLKRTKALIVEIEAEFTDGLTALKSDGKAGTFVSRELVYSYAMHISPAFELKVIRAFDKQARAALRHAKAEWIEARESGKDIRSVCTETIQRFVGYSIERGSSNADRYFTLLTNLANKCADIHGRGMAEAESLLKVAAAESVIVSALLDGMAGGHAYKSIYLEAKGRVEKLGELL